MEEAELKTEKYIYLLEINKTMHMIQYEMWGSDGKYIYIYLRI